MEQLQPKKSSMFKYTLNQEALDSRNTLIRPKSAKGRRRSSLQTTAIGYSTQDPVLGSQGPDTILRSTQGHSAVSSAPVLCSSTIFEGTHMRRGSHQDFIPCDTEKSGTPRAQADWRALLLPRLPSSLNKYSILPSIGTSDRTVESKGDILKGEQGQMAVEDYKLELH